MAGGALGPESRGGVGAGAKPWAAITGVWASKYNERAVLSCRKAGIKHEDVSMAVLCQPVVQAQYAFVLHTTNPQTGDANEIYGEMVCGMGEALVGNFAGRALSFVAKKNDLSNRESHRVPVQGERAVHRRDRRSSSARTRNGEDLEGFAGAGLYDSIQMHEATLRPVDYSSDPLVSDEAVPRAGRWRPSRTRRSRSRRRSVARRTSRGASPPTARCTSCRRGRRCERRAGRVGGE